MWAPPVISWFINTINYSYLRTINHSEIGLMFTNLAIERGPHIVLIHAYPTYDRAYLFTSSGRNHQVLLNYYVKILLGFNNKHIQDCPMISLILTVDFAEPRLWRPPLCPSL